MTNILRRKKALSPYAKHGKAPYRYSDLALELSDMGRQGKHGDPDYVDADRHFRLREGIPLARERRI